MQCNLGKTLAAWKLLRYTMLVQEVHPRRLALLLIAKVLLLIAKVLFHALRASVVMGSGPAPAGWSVLMVLARLVSCRAFFINY